MRKKELRSLYLQRRESMNPSSREALDKKISDKLCDLLLVLQPKHINCFLSSEAKNEVSTKAIITWALNHNITVTVPISNYKDASIRCYSISKDTEFCLDQYAIPTPSNLKENQFLKATNVDVMIVPLLIADNQGYRVGYGKGMYDRFIANCSKELITIGVGHFDPIKKIEDCDPYDQSLNYLITPYQQLQF